MFDRLYPSFKTRALIDERNFDMNRYDKYSDRYVIPDKYMNKPLMITETPTY
jgi:hypothetical protein